PPARDPDVSQLPTVASRSFPSRRDRERERRIRTSFRYSHLHLGLLQPVRHPHLAVHRRRGGVVLVRLLALARAPVELAAAEMAVGDKGAHADFTSGLRTTRPATSSRLEGRPWRSLR